MSSGREWILGELWQSYMPVKQEKIGGKTQSDH